MISTVTPLESPEVLQRGTIVEFPMTRDDISGGDSCILVLGGMMLVMEHRLAPVLLERGKISTAWTSTRDSGTLTPLSLQCWVRNLTGQFSCVYSATLTFPSEKHCHGNKRNYLSSHLRKGSTQVCFALMFGLGRCKGVVSDFIQAGFFLPLLSCASCLQESIPCRNKVASPQTASKLPLTFMLQPILHQKMSNQLQIVNSSSEQIFQEPVKK